MTRLQNSKVLKFNLINTNHGNCEALLSNGENAPYAQQAKNVNEDVLTLSELFNGCVLEERSRILINLIKLAMVKNKVKTLCIYAKKIFIDKTCL